MALEDLDQGITSKEIIDLNTTTKEEGLKTENEVKVDEIEMETLAVSEVFCFFYYIFNFVKSL